MLLRTRIQGTCLVLPSREGWMLICITYAKKSQPVPCALDSEALIIFCTSRLRKWRNGNPHTASLYFVLSIKYYRTMYDNVVFTLLIYYGHDKPLEHFLLVHRHQFPHTDTYVTAFCSLSIFL